MTELITFDWIEHPEDSRLSEALTIYVEAFENESITNYLLDLSHDETKQAFFELQSKFSKYTLSQGQKILIAKMNNEVVGLAILVLPNPESVTSSLKYLPNLAWSALKTARHVKWGRVINYLRTYPLISKNAEGAITLAILGVSSSKQGYGIGRKLLLEIISYANTLGYPLYLVTGLDKTRDYYKTYQFDVVESHQSDQLTIYEMLRQ
ncbi:GNAT family N-acetyltransferase [Aerococcaceae bacterium DSM 111176]|nr:GNAT family N-acetyltransferase [Aerococcaceae bacterium DSM 111176]